MPKAKIRLSDKQNLYLYSTGVENFFINEFMPAAPGDYVKLYLYALMHAQYGLDVDMKEAAHSLGMTSQEIKDAWNYWAKNGIVRISEDQEGEIAELTIVSQMEMFYGNRKTEASRTSISSIAAGVNAYDANSSDENGSEYKNSSNASNYDTEYEERMKRILDAEIRYLYDQYESATGRTVSQKEIKKIAEAIKDYGITSDVMSYSIKYCTEREKYSIDYMFRVALRWTEAGCRDISQVKEHLDVLSKRNSYYGMVFREMGFSRLPNPTDREMMDKWFDEMGCSIGEVLDACKASAGKREPTLQYVAKVLENRKLEAGGIDTRQQASTTSYGHAYSNESYRRDSGSGREKAAPVQAKVSNKVLKDYYDYLRVESERIQNARIDELCEKLPEIRELYELENQLNAELLSGQLMKRSKEQRDAIKEQRHELERDKRRILVENAYEEDYLDRPYKCKKCGDTGYTDDGMVCVCGKVRAEEAYTWYQKIREQ